MTARPPLLVRALNAALGIDLADLAEARIFLRSPEGADLLDAWLAGRADDDNDDADDESPAATGQPEGTET